ncbi:MAG TPA: winged helix-turn-helix domain-containing protein [Cyclobacteriaceae bacterium]|nr:winged helix-turn-helix domain-containing protein [Cyclobacteriaceae bacterium]
MKKELRIRLFIDVDGEKFFGPGRVELLQHVDETGSIAKAAKAMGMSYKKAWAMVVDLNAKGQKPYVVSHKGGQKGGGAELTPSAKKMLAAYAKLGGQLKNLVKKNSGILKLV